MQFTRFDCILFNRQVRSFGREGAKKKGMLIYQDVYYWMIGFFTPQGFMKTNSVNASPRAFASEASDLAVKFHERSE